MSKFVERGPGKMSNLNKSTNNILVEKDFFFLSQPVPLVMKGKIL